MEGLHDGSAGCAINPVSFRERIWGPQATAPAARRRRLWAQLPGRADHLRAVAWWERELERLGVEVHSGVRADAAGVLRLRPDAVILATGARWSREGRGFHGEAGIPGADLPWVLRPDEFLEGGGEPRGRVLVYDAEGLHAGMGIGERLALQGAEVEFLTPNPLPLSSRTMAARDGHFMIERFRRTGGQIRILHRLRAIEARGVVVEDLATGALSPRARPSGAPRHRAGGGGRSGTGTGGAGWRSSAWWETPWRRACGPRPPSGPHRFARLVGEPEAPPTTLDSDFSYDDAAWLPRPADAADRVRTRAGGGAQGRNRTTDTGIFSPLLYRLSYLGEREGAYLIAPPGNSSSARRSPAPLALRGEVELLVGVVSFSRVSLRSTRAALHPG
ncbi:MAG: hypothetical protein KatS3mg124_1479 [Porticoccaceae bacterium]|nr:MAG: hypothetical protein KatS3mg124_1479 [Porticoccaceae bacterium]